MAEKLISEAQIASRLEELGRDITSFYTGKALTVLTIMNGGMFFAADLLRQIRLPLWVDTLAISSYKGLASSGDLEFRCRPKLSLAGRHILVVDDILDTGLTLDKIMNFVLANGALSVQSCVLLDKCEARSPDALKADWTGFTVPNQFVVGYGLDADEEYRNLPYVAFFPFE